MTMQGTPDFGEIAYTLTGLIVAERNADGSYETPVSISNGQMYVSEPEHDTDKLRGYGKYTRGLSVAVGCKVSLKMGGIDVDVLEIIAGATVSTSGTTPNQVRKVDLPAGGAGLGYFGVIGRVATDGGGVAVIWA